MKILEPQSAILTNVEVLAHFTLNPPHRSPQPPPNARNFTPRPDLRDHNTVIKELHNYVTRLSPHLLKYPSFAPKSDSDASQPSSLDAEPTDLDIALRNLIKDLKPFGLTKGEVLTIINLGVGLDTAAVGDGEVAHDGFANGDVTAGEANEVEMGDADDADYGALALLDTVIEDREERLTNEDVTAILRIVRETLGTKK
ncbi:hypothetical protein LOZ66_003694 [Ophidiomyces ophidiicola]|nr:hypothetical protein LOZ65_000176 [Ophidiomyces ophidiicola]KAI1938106.1 hypothetical protein LOZ66_003694 [Ophidiomyces ophidiicola]